MSGKLDNKQEIQDLEEVKRIITLAQGALEDSREKAAISLLREVRTKFHKTLIGLKDKIG